MKLRAAEPRRRGSAYRKDITERTPMSDSRSPRPT